MSRSKGPSPHLSWRELACKDGTPYPERWRLSRAIALAKAFEVVREAVGAPIAVSSAYRTPEWNRRVGGAPRSQHIEGRALDLWPPARMRLQEFYAVVRAEAKVAGIRGLGLYPTFVHIDVRPGNRLVCWHGKRVWAELP